MDANELILWKMGLMGGTKYKAAPKGGKGGVSWSSSCTPLITEENEYFITEEGEYFCAEDDEE